MNDPLIGRRFRCTAAVAAESGLSGPAVGLLNLRKYQNRVRYQKEIPTANQISPQSARRGRIQKAAMTENLIAPNPPPRRGSTAKRLKNHKPLSFKMLKSKKEGIIRHNYQAISE